MFGIKSLKTAALLTLIFFMCFLLSSDFSFSKVKQSQEQRNSELNSETADKPVPDSSVKPETENRGNSRVIEKPGVKNKKRKKKFPWLLVIGATVVIGVVLYLLLKKNKKNNSTEDILTVGGSIKVESSPANARIWLDGKHTGKQTNTTLNNVSPGSHSIRLIKQGYWTVQRTIQVETGKTTSLVEILLETTVEWVHIPAGEFTMGYRYIDNEFFIYDSKPHMEPPHKVYLDNYCISKYEITFEQYDKFCRETGHRRSFDFGWGRGKQPAVDITYDDAVAYCDWISKKTGINIHLPTEAQWEKAARGTDERLLPWGGEIPPNRNYANFYDFVGHAVPVGSYPRGVSPYGVHDMAGNVTEWCQDWFDWTYYKISPYRNPQGPEMGKFRVKRGGDWNSHGNVILTTWRSYDSPVHPKHLGFRIAMEIE